MNLKRYQSQLIAAALAMLCSAAQGAAPNSIEVKDFMFTPTTITIDAGEKVTWVNKDDEPHTVVSDTGLFRSGAMDTEESFSFEFDKPGTYHYICSIHPRMVGTVVVLPGTSARGYRELNRENY